MAEDIRTMHEEDEDEVKYCERKRLLFFGLPWTFTKYTITPSMLTIDQGLLKTEENDCYMYKVQDVKLTTMYHFTGCECCGPHMCGPYRAANRQWSASLTPPNRLAPAAATHPAGPPFRLVPSIKKIRRFRQPMRHRAAETGGNMLLICSPSSRSYPTPAAGSPRRGPRWIAA